MSLDLRVVEVTTKRQWRDFYSIRQLVYKNDPAAVRPLRSMERTALDVNKHPFYQHASRAVFVVYRDGMPSGRIVAIKDDLHNEHYQDRVGFFGFFECVDDLELAKPLVEAAKQWLVKEGCDAMRGPVNPSMKGELGVLVDGNDKMPFVMMGHTPKYYENLLLGCGLSIAKEFYCYQYISRVDNDLQDRWGKLHRMVEACAQKFPELEFRQTTKQTFESTMRDINQLGNQVRALNYGFVPLTDAELSFMISQLRRVIHYDTILAAYWNDQIVGFIVNIPDINWALKKSKGPWDWVRIPQFLYWLRKTPRARVIAIGVDDEFRKKGIALTLINSLVKRHLDYKEWEFSWVVEDNVKSMRVINRTMSLNQYKTYRLYEKPI